MQGFWERLPWLRFKWCGLICRDTVMDAAGPGDKGFDLDHLL
jgi:hypothetical protein